MNNTKYILSIVFGILFSTNSMYPQTQNTGSDLNIIQYEKSVDEVDGSHNLHGILQDEYRDQKLRCDDELLCLFPKIYSSTDETWKFIEYTIDKTQELISFYESDMPLLERKNEIGFVVPANFADEKDACLELMPKYRDVLIFLGEIAGYDICASGGYADPMQFQYINKVEEVLDYYRTHDIDRNAVIIYYYINFASEICSDPFWRSQLYGYSAFEMYFINITEEEEYPESLPVALETIDNAGTAVNRALFNILNKKTISELEKETIKDNQ